MKEARLCIMDKKIKFIKKVKDTLHYSVPDISYVDGAQLARLAGQADAKKFRFIPDKPVQNVYAEISRNIPSDYKIRLSYWVEKKDLRFPQLPDRMTGFKVQPFRSHAEIGRVFQKTFTADYLKPFYPKTEWKKELGVSLPIMKGKVALDDAFRVVRKGSCVGLMLLPKLETGQDYTLVGWIWVARRLTALERPCVHHLMFSWLKGRMLPKAAAGVDGFNPASQGLFRKTGFSLMSLNISK